MKPKAEQICWRIGIGAPTRQQKRSCLDEANFREGLVVETRTAPLVVEGVLRIRVKEVGVSDHRDREGHRVDGDRESDRDVREEEDERRAETERRAEQLREAWRQRHPEIEDEKE
jgi:hypothetical protein